MRQISVTFASAPCLIQPILYGDGCYSVFNPSLVTMFLDNVLTTAAINNNITYLSVDSTSGAKYVVALRLICLFWRQ
jgi:archaellum biogenesis protein FlaJ (TadC family)